MNIYKSIIRPLLFSLPPEMSHSIVENLLFYSPSNITKTLFRNQVNSLLEIEIFGQKFSSPVGLAAGLDKNCKTSQHYLNMGFGFSVVGTVMKHPRLGNKKPRLLRLNNEEALINSLAFPSEGSGVIFNRINKLQSIKNKLIVSVSGILEDEILYNVEYFKGQCFGFEINISSPNTNDLSLLVNQVSIKSLSEKVRRITDDPIFFKLPRFEDLNLYRDLVGTMESFPKIGVVLTNSLPVDDKRLKVGRGGKSGRPLFEDTLNILRAVRKEFPEIPIISCGGINSAEDVFTLLESGATAIQLYTSLIFNGPFIANKINSKLLSIIKTVKE